MRVKQTGILALIAVAAAAWAAAAPPKKTPLQPVERGARAMSGRELYVAYCASCHGLEGKGDGPASEAMRMQPTDLTTLARKHGKFPVLRVQRLLGGIEGLPAHGGKRMPVWGPVFLPVSPASGEDAALIDRLVRYLESIQQPPANP